MRLTGGLRLATALALCASGAAVAQQAMPDGDWRTINRDPESTRYSPLTEITRANVAQLKQAWAYPLKGSNTATPLVVDSTMYFPVGNRVIALDADTGAEKWVYTIPNGPDGKAGTFIATMQGKRFTNGEWPAEDPQVYPG